METLPFLSSLAGRRLPSPAYPSSSTPPFKGSDLDKRFCPQLLLIGLGGMRGGTTEGHREGRETDIQTQRGGCSCSRHPENWELLAAWITT